MTPAGVAPMMAASGMPSPMPAPAMPSPMMAPPAGLVGALPVPSSGPLSTPVPGAASGPHLAPPGVSASGGPCPRCGTSTPAGFAYCQQCGLHVQAFQPTDPAAHGRSHRPSTPGAMPGAPSVRAQPLPASAAEVDPHLATLAADGAQAGALRSPAGRAEPAAGPAWGTAVLVNRDGSDGQRFPLAGDYCVVGRAGADIAFADDRFLARQHARFERAADGGVKVHPLDTLNGVFRKVDQPIELVDGMTILVGREVLRYEKVALEEARAGALIRHGVALFGSPPREPWGRLMQVVPSGGHRDVRHLVGDEAVLGREEGDLVFRDDAFMSRRHAAVRWDGNTARLIDLGSSNGTFVRIPGPTTIRHGDHVRMGDQLLRIELGN